MAKKNWVSYQEIKDKVSMAMVLERYGLLPALKESGKNLVGCCPIHKGSNPRQFSVNLERNIFNCFGNCHAGGNVIDLVAMMEKVELRQAALLLRNWFLPSPSDTPEQDQPAPPKPKEKAAKLVREEKKGAGTVSPVEGEPGPGPINPPLTFELKNLKPEHSFFTERGLAPATVAYFGLGFCSRGMMAGRIVIPIHNQVGELVAYCGRAVDAKQAEEAKYKMPGNFLKSAVVYNLHRQAPGTDLLVLVESFLSVFWLHQAGYPHVVALMGSFLSPEHEKAIADFLGPSGRVILLFDGDESGQKCTADSLDRLGRKLFVKAVDISPYGKKPHQLDPDILKQIL
jgi:DNA primase